MEAHSSKRFECRKCGTKFIHKKSYEQHLRAKCLGHRKRIAARKLQIEIPDCSDEDVPRKCFMCKYCEQEYNFRRTMEIHVQQKHPEHKGDVTTAYTSSGKGVSVENSDMDTEESSIVINEAAGGKVKSTSIKDNGQVTEEGSISAEEKHGSLKSKLKSMNPSLDIKQEDSVTGRNGLDSHIENIAV